MTDIATLAVKVKIDGADQAATGLSKVAAAGKKAANDVGSAATRFTDAAGRLREANGRFVSTGNTLDTLGKKAKSLKDRLGDLAPSFSTLGTIVGGLGLAALASSFVDANKESERLSTSLTSITGSASEARKNLDFLREFAKDTPAGLNEATEAFIALRVRGVKPTMDELKGLADLGSAFSGKSVKDAVDAVTAATRGEYDQLEGFGLAAKAVGKEGDKLALTFNGVTTVVKKDTDSIMKYMSNLGKTKFGGAAAAQMKTLGGSLDSLAESWRNLMVKFGETGISEALAFVIRGIGSALDFMADNINIVTGILAGAFAGAMFYAASVVLPLLVTGLTLATTAVKAFSAALMRNPLTIIFSLLALAIGAVVTAILDFKDELSDAAGKAVSLAKTLSIVWEGVKTTFRVVTEEIGKMFGSLMNYMIGLAAGFWKDVQAIWNDGDLSFSNLTEAFNRSIDGMDFGRIKREYDNAFDAKRIGKGLADPNDPKKDPPPPPGGSGDPDKEREKARKAYEERLKDMAEERDFLKYKNLYITQEETLINRLNMDYELGNLRKKAGIEFTKEIKDREGEVVKTLAEQRKEYDRMVELKSHAKSLIEDLKTPMEQYREEIKKVNEELEKKLLTPEQAELGLARAEERRQDNSRNGQDGLKRGLRGLADEVNDDAAFMEDTVVGAFDSMGDAMAELVTEGKISFGDLAKSMIADMVKIATMRASLKLFDYVFPGMGAAGSAALGAATTKSANGNVFQNGNVVPFATGGVVTRATQFPMANGGTGLMGEAGPEGILPLSRGTNGKLGVIAHGNDNGGGGNLVIQMSTEINVNGSASEEDAQKTAQQFDAYIRSTVRSTLNEEFRNMRARGRAVG